MQTMFLSDTQNFPPSTLLYIDGLVDIRAKVEIEVTAFVPGA